MEPLYRRNIQNSLKGLKQERSGKAKKNLAGKIQAEVSLFA